MCGTYVCMNRHSESWVRGKFMYTINIACVQQLFYSAHYPVPVFLSIFISSLFKYILCFVFILKFSMLLFHSLDVWLSFSIWFDSVSYDFSLTLFGSVQFRYLFPLKVNMHSYTSIDSVDILLNR